MERMEQPMKKKDLQSKIKEKALTYSLNLFWDSSRWTNNSGGYKMTLLEHMHLIILFQIKLNNKIKLFWDRIFCQN